MRLIKWICIFLSLIITCTGCVAVKEDSGFLIVPPENTYISIQGTWEVVEVLSQSSTDEEKLHWIGNKVIFSKEYAIVAGYFIEDVGYQGKRVNTDEYLLYHYKNFPKDYPLSEEKIEIITITDKEVFFCEALKAEEEKLLLKIYGDTLVLEKVSDEINEKMVEDLRKEGLQKEKVEGKGSTDDKATGVLLGLRQDQSYRTLWIALENEDFHPILETEGIFFPRKNGFWKMETKEVIREGGTEILLDAHNISVIREEVTEVSNEEIHYLPQIPKNIYRTIHFISNDYVAIEEKIYENYQGKSILRGENLHVLAIDSLPRIKKVSIVDLLGEMGVEAIKSGRKEILREIGSNVLPEIEGIYENYGLERRLGHWFLKGRLSYFDRNKLITRDYNIHLIPPSKLVFYDELWLPWTTVKDRIPTAIDLYTSPNKALALVITQKEIMVFPIHGEEIAKEPLERIVLKEEEKVVMAEWAIGHYVENWKKAFQDYIDDSKRTEEPQ